MPSIGPFTPACYLDQLPVCAPDRYVLLGDEGFVDQSVLFFPERFVPVRQRLVLTADSPDSMSYKIAALRALRNSYQTVDDGLRRLYYTLIMGVEFGPLTPCAMIVGGSSAADIWEQEVVVTILPRSPEMQ